MEDLWRGLKQTVAGNRCHARMEEPVERAAAWLDDPGDAGRRRRCGLDSSKFDWLPT